MAFLKKVKRSQYWYIRHRDIETGEWRDRSTKYVRGVAQDDRAAQKEADQDSAKEAKIRPETGAEFIAWVPAFITSHYTRPSTRKRYDLAWMAIRRWMVKRNIRVPRQVRYQHAQDYLDWRVKEGAKHNTARLEVKFFSFIMNEAIRREYSDRNPLEKAKIERAPVAEKPEILDDALKTARQYFIDHDKPEWMLDVFEILMNLGCRFAEASIPVARIDFEAKTILMTDSKRKDHDPRKNFPVPVTDQFLGFLKKFQGRERTTPLLTGAMNQRFNVVLKKACGATSHSFRVSFISRCHRAGLAEQECMRLVNHSSHLVHRIYSRMSVEDSRRALQRVPLPPPPLSPKTPAPSE